MDKKIQKYYNYIHEELVRNTHKPMGNIHWYVFDCNVSVHMSHGSVRPYFMWVPECFEKVVQGRYGVREDELEIIFDRYGEWLIDHYLKHGIR